MPSILLTLLNIRSIRDWSRQYECDIWEGKPVKPEGYGGILTHIARQEVNHGPSLSSPSCLW